MSDNVSITFSAQIGELVAGVEGVKSSLESISSTANGVAAALGVGFSVEAIESFVSQMEELATQTQHTAAILGVSTAETQELGLVAKASGASAQTFALSMERLQVNLARAQTGLGPAAEALQALGLSAKSLIGLPLDEQMNKIADAVARFGDGGNKTAIVLSLLGRSGAEMIPILDQGSAGLEAFRARLVDAGTIMTGQTITALDKMGTESTILSASLKTLGGTLLALGAQDFGGFSTYVEKASADMTALASTGQLGAYVARIASGAWERLGHDISFAATLMKDFFSASPATLAADYKAGLASIDAADQNYVAQLDAMVAHAKVAYGDLLSAGSASGKPQAPALPVPDMTALNAAITQYQTMVKQADDGYAQIKQLYAGDVAAHRMSVTQETQDLLAALQFRHQAEDSVYAQALAAAQGDAAKYASVQKEKTAADDKFALEHQQIIDAAVKKEEQAWTSMLQPIEGAFNSQLRSLLDGTKTFGQAFKSVLGDLLVAFIEWCEKQVVQWTVTQLAMAVVGNVTKNASSLPAIQSDAGQAFAGFAAFLAPTLGPAAIPTALGMATSMEATAVGLASADIGGHVLSDGALNVHAGETITPAAIAQPYQGDGAGAGGVALHINAPMVGTQQWTQSTIRQLAGVLKDYQARSPSMAW